MHSLSTTVYFYALPYFLIYKLHGSNSNMNIATHLCSTMLKQ